jgi:DNA recombination protein RmuC
MIPFILLAIGVVAGAIGAWLAAAAKNRAITAELRSQVELVRADLGRRDQEARGLQQELRKQAEQRATAEAELLQTQRSLAEQKQMLDEAKRSLADTFGALAGQALQKNSDEFLRLAATRFQTLEVNAKSELEKRQDAISALVNPLAGALERYEKQIHELEASRQNAYGGLNKQLTELQGVTRSLDLAMRTPRGRGSWGELTLRRVAELAGMSEHCDFSEQETLFSESGRQRPDMIVNLPGGRRIAIDAKAPLEAYREFVSAATDEERNACLARHSQQVRTHMNQLGSRGYWQQLDSTTDFVVLFLPGESFFGAALEQDTTLIEDGIEKGVILATPTTLIALLRAVAYGWGQERAAENAQKIGELGKELYDRMKKFVDHLDGVGTSLRKAVETYNRAIGSFESRVMPAARKFEELGSAPEEEIGQLEILEEIPRVLAVPERSEVE